MMTESEAEILVKIRVIPRKPEFTRQAELLQKYLNTDTMKTMLVEVALREALDQLEAKHSDYWTEPGDDAE